MEPIVCPSPARKSLKSTGSTGWAPSLPPPCAPFGVRNLGAAQRIGNRPPALAAPAGLFCRVLRSAADGPRDFLPEDAPRRVVRTWTARGGENVGQRGDSGSHPGRDGRNAPARHPPAAPGRARRAGSTGERGPARGGGRPRARGRAGTAGPAGARAPVGGDRRRLRALGRRRPVPRTRRRGGAGPLRVVARGPRGRRPGGGKGRARRRRGPARGPRSLVPPRARGAGFCRSCEFALVESLRESYGEHLQPFDP